MFSVSEMHGPTIQGEGLHAGWPCFILRFAGCNLWPAGARYSATCPWCDTPQVGTAHMYASVDSLWAVLAGKLNRIDTKVEVPYGLIITGGEPLMQLNQKLLTRCANVFPWIDIETNGTLEPAFDRDKHDNVFVCVSPKTKEAVRKPNIRPDFYKLLYPAKKNLLKDVRKQAEKFGAPIYIQPQEPRHEEFPTDEAQYSANIAECVRLVLEEGDLRLSLQLHKYVGLP